MKRNLIFLLCLLSLGGTLLESINKGNPSYTIPQERAPRTPQSMGYLPDWYRLWGYSWIDRNYNIWGDNLGHIYTVGYSDINGLDEGLILRYNATGDYCWNLTYAAPCAQNSGFSGTYLNGLWGDGNYNLYLVGNAWNDTGSPNNTWILLRINDAGTNATITGEDLWYSPSNQTASGICGDGAGNLYVVGGTGSQGPSHGLSDGLLVKYNTITLD